MYSNDFAAGIIGVKLSQKIAIALMLQNVPLVHRRLYQESSKA
jgi:hypothetical protein